MAKSNGYISNTGLLTNGSHGKVVEKQRPGGTTHTTVYNEKENRRVSFNTSKDGKVSNIHTTNQNTRQHQNYGSR
jgi:hypothetical protein